MIRLTGGAWLLLLTVQAYCAPRFDEVAASAGIDFVHDNGMQGQLWLVELVGSGVGVLDFDGDGLLDIWFVQGGPLPGGGGPGDRLFRNTSSHGDLHFVDITDSAGVKATDYGMGIATGDVDNDGDLDVFLANFGPNQLFENLGNGRFRDVTTNAGLTGDDLSVSASFADINGDGRVDLYVANYADFTLGNHRACNGPDGQPDYCGPKSYPPTPDRLYLNQGGLHFADISQSAGIGANRGTGLGVVADDFDLDGKTDFYVANDMMENTLWRNQGNGRFVNQALLAGVAVNADGLPEASMGIAVADYDDDGDPDLFLTHLTGETNTLYVNDGNGWFTDSTNAANLATSSRPFTGFGTGWADVDNDGHLDLFSANGAVTLIRDQRDAGIPHPLRQRNQLWLNDGHGRYQQVDGGTALALEEVSRGAAFADLDNDGDIDIIVSNNGGPARIYRNNADPAHWIGIDLRGAASSPLAFGATVHLDGDPGRHRRVRTDGSFASASDARIVFGLGTVTSPRFIRVDWPDGTRERFGPLAPDRYHRLVYQQGDPDER